MNVRSRRSARDSGKVSSNRITPEEILDISQSAAEEFFRDLTPHRIRDEVQSKLHKEYINVLMGAMGVTKGSFDRLEFDNRSPGWKLIAEHVKEAVDEFLKGYQVDFQELLNADGFNDTLMEEYREEYRRRLRKGLQEAAVKEAEKDAERIVAATLQDGARLRELADSMISELDREASASFTFSGNSFSNEKLIDKIRVLAIVNINHDGWMSENLSDPNDTAWFLIRIGNDKIQGDAYIVSNCERWHPARITKSNSGIDFQNSQVTEKFNRAELLAFQFLGEADKEIINGAISEFLKDLLCTKDASEH